MTSICGIDHDSVVRLQRSTNNSKLFIILLLITSLAIGRMAHAGDLDRIVRFDISPQRLDTALLEFGTQASIQIAIAPRSGAKDIRTKGVKGSISGRQALTTLLSGTPLKFVERGRNVQVIRSVPDPQAPEPKVKRGRHIPAAPAPTASIPLKEIVITGTHIEGITSTASFTSSYSRNYVYSTGAGSIAQFIQQLPGNFSEASDVSVTSTQGGPGFTLNNNVAAAGIDLHGLGAQSTLVLVNGYRLAPGNYNGGFVDVSMLPLSAVDHIDVVADSASAIYGSDAVGGVANIVMLQRFEGAETRVRYGSVTDGGRHEVQVSETTGTSWSGGSAVLSYQYSDTTPLSASSRAFSQDAPIPFSLLPEQTAHEVYASLTESPSESTTLSGFLVYGHRDANANFVDGGIAALRRDGSVNSGVAELGMHKQFAWGGIGSASVEYSANDSTWLDSYGFLPDPANYTLLGTAIGKSGLGSFDLGLSGAFGHWAGRHIRYAVGAQVRSERYSYTNEPLELTDSRTIASEYAELWVPVLPSLDVSLDDREEHYSDFGKTNNTKVGLNWIPLQAIVVHATYSTAFRAPSLYDLLNIDQAAFTPVPNSSASGPCAVPGPGCTNALVLDGGNPRLSAEKAKTWTAGVDWTPSSISGANIGVSYYDIRYHDRINTADSAINIYNSLADDQAELGPGLVRYGVSPLEIQQLAQLAGPDETFTYGGVDPATVTTLIDDRLLNLASLSTRGVDFKASYVYRLDGLRLRSELSGTRIIQYTNQFTPFTPPVDSLDTAYNPLRLKARLSETIATDAFSGSVAINYAGPYTNNAVLPSEPVASWTTMDASVTYAKGLGSSAGERAGSLTLGVMNALNRSPPYVQNPYFPVNFDGANASPLGRFVYLEIRVAL